MSGIWNDFMDAWFTLFLDNYHKYGPKSMIWNKKWNNVMIQAKDYNRTEISIQANWMKRARGILHNHYKREWQRKMNEKTSNRIYASQCKDETKSNKIRWTKNNWVIWEMITKEWNIRGNLLFLFSAIRMNKYYSNLTRSQENVKSLPYNDRVISETINKSVGITVKNESTAIRWIQHEIWSNSCKKNRLFSRKFPNI